MSTFRKTYRELTLAEIEHIEQIKDAAHALEILIEGHVPLSIDVKGADQRCVRLAMTILEQAVMWAVKAYT
jgi:hypothetical protein